MVTLANLQGSSLVSQFGAPIAGGIDRLQGRRRETAATTELEDLLRGALGQAPLEREDQPSGEGLLAQLQQGGGLFGKIGQGGGTALPEQRPQAEGGLLGRLSPGLARAINSARGNPEQEGQLREQVDSGAALSAELQALPNHAARVRRLAQEGGNLSARGEDIGRVTALSNLPPGQLDLELMKMQMIGEEAQQQLPALGEQGSIAAITARNPQLGTSLLQRRDRQIEAERSRRAAAQRSAASSAAAAAAPQGEFAKGLAQINRNEQLGHITPDQAAARRTALESRLLTDPGIASGVEADQAAANLLGTQLENQAAQIALDAPGGGDTFAIETEINADGSTIQATGSGEIIVKNAAGEVVEGQARLDVLEQSRLAQGDLARTIAAEKAAGTQAIKVSGEAFNSLATVRVNIANLNEAIGLIQEGAPSGPIQNLLPNVTKGAIALGNVQNRLGLDIVSQSTFGALSKGELDLALDTALPTGLEEAELEQWITRRRDAQVKLSGYLNEAATFLGTPGNTIADWTIQQNDKQRQAVSAAVEGRSGAVPPPVPSGFGQIGTVQRALAAAPGVTVEMIWNLATPQQREAMQAGQ